MTLWKIEWTQNDNKTHWDFYQGDKKALKAIEALEAQGYRILNTEAQ